MLSIDEIIIDSERTRLAKKNLMKFNEKMELIKKYPIKPHKLASSPQYTKPNVYT